MFSIISTTKGKRNKLTAEYEAAMGKSSDVVQVTGGATYAPGVFRKLRHAWGIDDDEYRKELSSVKKLGEGAGKSKMLFWISKHKRFFLKTMPKGEIDTLVGDVLDAYAAHMHKYPNSLLPRILGIYREDNVYFLVQTNINFNLNNPWLYDLKGSHRKREIATMKRGAVGKDNNFGSSCLATKMSTRIKKMLRLDSQFLARMNLMDYSLLVAIEPMNSRSTCKPLCDTCIAPAGSSFVANFHGPPPSGSQRVCVHIGIIDILQDFGIKKTLES
ncbi:MAG: hypothetical protein K0U10_06735, partial [Gammaproteobacteria bacterium]|nr:hypothetical protein [Gammaproteobacteria bacterium]